ncbi:hypothetical protein VO64_0741 [Pseudomonas synxantha]|uniref:Uncharacterized protein n=1 Tax=Pseudomonas synxantha TaxID=47883 RepID=A0AAU8TFK5_9PSED|nr:hypothetical protein VO64_0741 [Pseudomonas synxantha]
MVGIVDDSIHNAGSCVLVFVHCRSEQARSYCKSGCVSSKVQAQL